LTFIHILPGAFFLGLAPLQFLPRFRERNLKFHRRMGTLLVICALIIGVSALVMSFTMNIGGANNGSHYSVRDRIPDLPGKGLHLRAEAGDRAPP
jgi:hypothetical protein